MNAPHTVMQRIVKLGLILMMGVSMSACSKSWKEEVQLHDGSKIVVERMVDRGGRHEIGQESPIKEQSMVFDLPTTNERITWKTEFSKDIGLADFKPILLDIVQGKTYIVTTPMGCLAYNKWGRPNPPYVAFKYEGKEWKRIQLQELPAEINTPNLIISSPDDEVGKIGKSFVPTEIIKKLNGELTQPEYKTILREPLPAARINEMCEPMVHYKCGWTGTRPDGTFDKEFMDRMCK
ncbi:MAG: hypothetical protein Q8O24_02630 [Gallionellaceae bacterium]|nr:hypothetical protein [Gallionellaceae bacterium]